jgi:hypothetical protein
VGVAVEPGTGEGGIVETTKLVTVNVGPLITLGGGRVGELVSGGLEGEDEPGELEGNTVVGGGDEGLMVGGLGVSENAGLEGGENSEEGKPVGEEGLMVGELGVNEKTGLDEGETSEEGMRVEGEWWDRVGLVIEDGGGVGSEILDEIEGTESVSEGDTEGGMLELDGRTVELELGG